MKIPILQEFKEFALRGNVVDLAVGVIIGAAFGKIVSALVADVIMPPTLPACSGNIDFTNLYFPFVRESPAGAGDLRGVSPQTQTRICRWIWRRKAGPVLAWGDFITISTEFHHRRVLYLSAGERHERAQAS